MFKVIRLKDKRPVEKNWPELAQVVGEDIIQNWIKDGYGVGIVTGKVNNLLVIDIDIKGGGFYSLDKLEDEYGKLPDTLQVRTQSGGRHYYFKLPSGKFKNFVGVEMGIDIRAEGGQVVAPPTKNYNYINKNEILDLPSKWVDFLKSKNKEKSRDLDVGEIFGDGERNDKLFKVACSMRSRGFTEEVILDTVKSVYENQCTKKPPIRDRELKTIVKSACKFERGKFEDAMSSNVINLADLMKKKLPERKVLIEGMMYQGGVYLLAGEQKMGKSWLVLDMMLRISNNESFLGKYSTSSKILYFDLEGDEYSMQERVLEIGGNNNIDVEKIFIDHYSTLIGEDFVSYIKQKVVELGINLFVIDVVGKIRSDRKYMQSEYSHDYKDIGVLKDLAKETGATFLLIHHMTKSRFEEDIFKSIRGSSGLTGAVDGSFVFDRVRNEKSKAKLHMTGRHFPEDVLDLELHNSRWYCKGSKAEKTDEKTVTNTFVTIFKEILGSKKIESCNLNKIREIASNKGLYVSDNNKSLMAEINGSCEVLTGAGISVERLKRSVKGIILLIKYI